MTVEVFIKDQNDNAPFFRKPLYEVTVAEDQYIDTAFAYINADDPDESKHCLHNCTLFLLVCEEQIHWNTR